MKAVNQIGVALGIVAMTESLAYAELQGISAELALDILQGGAAGSWALSHYAPRVLRGDLKPGFRAEHMLKDLRIALEDVVGRCELPGAEVAARLFEQLVISETDVGNHALMKVYGREIGVLAKS
jgi:3-hydroxyisobutyrate dehydrogenase